MNSQQIETMQEISSFAVQAMGLAMFSQVFGVIASASIAAGATSTPLDKLIASDAAIKDLTNTYGRDIVAPALKKVPSHNAIELAEEIEDQIYIDMRKRYGESNANMAIQNAPAGQILIAERIAKSLSEDKITPSTPPAKVAAAVHKASHKGRQKAKPVRDTKTGISYETKTSAGQAVAHEYPDIKIKRGDPGWSYVWYEVLKRDPNRFVAL